MTGDSGAYMMMWRLRLFRSCMSASTTSGSTRNLPTTTSGSTRNPPTTTSESTRNLPTVTGKGVKITRLLKITNENAGSFHTQKKISHFILCLLFFLKFQKKAPKNWLALNCLSVSHPKNVEWTFFLFLHFIFFNFNLLKKQKQFFILVNNLGSRKKVRKDIKSNGYFFSSLSPPFLFFVFRRPQKWRQFFSTKCEEELQSSRRVVKKVWKKFFSRRLFLSMHFFGSFLLMKTFQKKQKVSSFIPRIFSILN